MPQRLQKAKKQVQKKEAAPIVLLKKFHFSKTFGISFFIVGILVGATAWTTYKALALPGPVGTGSFLAPTDPPPYGNPYPPLQAKAAATDVQTTNGFLKVGFTPSDTAPPSNADMKLIVNGTAVAKDFCTNDSNPKCLSQTGSGTSSSAPAAAGSGWTIEKDVSNCTLGNCLGTLPLSGNKEYQVIYYVGFNLGPASTNVTTSVFGNCEAVIRPPGTVQGSVLSCSASSAAESVTSNLFTTLYILSDPTTNATYTQILSTTTAGTGNATLLAGRVVLRSRPLP